VTTQAERWRAVRYQARTYAERLRDVADEFVSRDEVVQVVGLAALCREHVLIIGPPGTAKTSLLDQFRRTLDVRYFGYLLTKFTEPAELFGPIDVQRFQQESVFSVNTHGMLPQAHIAFLDEVFQGSSAILNTLLTLINERTFHNGSRIEPACLLTLLGSTNELPTDPVLAAFSDRFLLRCSVDYVAADEIEEMLKVGWRHEQQAMLRQADPDSADADLARFPLAELQDLQQEVINIDISGIRAKLATVIRELRGEGVEFSDRRAVKAQKLIAGSALLAARREAAVDDLGVLAYLWSKSGDDITIRRVLADHDIPVGQPMREKREASAIELDLTEIVAADGGGSLEGRREKVARLFRLSREADRDQQGATDLRERIKAAYHAALDDLRADSQGA